MPIKNQVYCSSECRQQAIKNAAMKKREHKRRLKRMQKRPCCKVCGAYLSIYGQGNTCSNHSHPQILSNVLKGIRNKYENGDS